MIFNRVSRGVSARAATALAGFLAIMTTLPLEAQQTAPIELRSHDGSIAIEGQLLEYSDGFYIIDTALGRMRIDASEMDCIGAICPVTEAASPRFGIYGSRTVGTTLIPSLLGGYAASVGATLEITETGDDATRIAKLINADGSIRAEIDLQTRGSGSAFPALADRVADIGLADRRMNDGDLEKLQAAGLPELRDTENEIVLGVDGIALIIHKDNPVRNLSTEDVSRIWSGEITNWLELGGGNYPITVNTYGEGSGDREVFLNGLVRPNGRGETAEVTRHGPYQDLVNAVMADRGGVGFVGRWLAKTNDVKLVDIREECGLISAPSDFRMKIEGYSLSRRLYAYKRPGVMHPEARAFLDWTLTDAAQPYVKAAAFIDRDLERMRLEDMGMAMIHTAAVEPDFSGVQYATMMRELRFADRLSISFRFQTGSSVLDVESVRNLRELGERMERGEFDGQEVLLVGFADSVGDRDRNTALAARRADEVRRILADALADDVEARLKLIPLSFGELMPLSCNTDEVGKARNRRVEVWLRVPGQDTNLR